MKFRFLFFILFSLGIVFSSAPYIENLGDEIINYYYVYKTKKDLIIIKTCLDTEKDKNGTYPPSHRFAHWYKTNLSGKFKYNFPLDRWGQPYIYKSVNEKMDFILSSSGKDQKPDTKNDLKIKNDNKNWLSANN